MRAIMEAVRASETSVCFREFTGATPQKAVILTIIVVYQKTIPGRDADY
jgi:hypothetical protein